MGALGVVQVQRAGERVEDRGGHPGDRAALELGVVLDADPGQGGDLGAAQPRDPALADVGQAGVGGGDLRASGDEELADLGSVVHGSTVGRVAPADRPCWYTPTCAPR